MKKYPAVALIEFSSIAAGMVSADAMIKKAPIAMLKAGTVSRGNFLILIGGSVASVEEAFAEGLAKGENYVADKVMLPAVHPQVHDTMLGSRNRCSGDAVGVIETKTVATVIRAVVAGVKGAAVDLVEMRLGDGLGGKSFAVFTGTIEDVDAAVQIARNAVGDTKLWLNDSQIPRLDSELAKQIEITTRFAAAAAHSLADGEA